MEKPVLWDVVNYLYHIVMDHMPKLLQDRDMGSAFVLGSVGSYAVTRGCQKIAKRYSPRFYEKAVPIIDIVTMTGIVGIPLVYSLIDPEGAREILRQHPTYSSGMLGASMGAFYAANKDLHDTSLDDKVAKDR